MTQEELDQNAAEFDAHLEAFRQSWISLSDFIEESNKKVDEVFKKALDGQ